MYDNKRMSLSSSQNQKMFRQSSGENQNTRFMFVENRGVY